MCVCVCGGGGGGGEGAISNIPAKSHICGLKTLISCQLTFMDQFLTPG